MKKLKELSNKQQLMMIGVPLLFFWIGMAGVILLQDYELLSQIMDEKYAQMTIATIANYNFLCMYFMMMKRYQRVCEAKPVIAWRIWWVMLFLGIVYPPVYFTLYYLKYYAS